MSLLIVTYHYYQNKKYKNGIYPVSHKEFEEEINNIQKKYTIINPDDFFEHWTSEKQLSKNRDYCLLTFDDGLKEQMNAFYFLQERKLGALFFVPTLPYIENQPLEVHKLQHIRSIMNDDEIYKKLDIEFKIKTYQFDKETLSTQYPYDNETSRKVKYFLNFVLPENEKKHFINAMFEAEWGDIETFTKNLYMTPNEISILDKNGMLGSHAHTHNPLGAMNPAEAKQDIKIANKYFYDRLGKVPPYFAYPYGGQSAIRSDLNDFFQAEGMKFIFTTEKKTNSLSPVPETVATFGRHDRKDLQSVL